MSSVPVEEYTDLLGKVEIFAGLDRVTLAKLAGHLEPVPVATGATLLRQGDPPDGLYVISRGTFGIFCAGPGSPGEIRLATCSRGEPIGEMALLTDDVRSATVRADGDGEVLRLDRTDFLRLVHQDPSVALAIAATLSRRLRAADAALLGHPRLTRSRPPGRPRPGMRHAQTAPRPARRLGHAGAPAALQSVWRWPGSCSGWDGSARRPPVSARPAGTHW